MVRKIRKINRIMIFGLIFISILLLSFNNTQASNPEGIYDVEFVIKDGDGNPIEGAKITVDVNLVPPYSNTNTTNALGKCIIKLSEAWSPVDPTAGWDATIEADGYKTLNTQVRVRGGEENIRTYALEQETTSVGDSSWSLWIIVIPIIIVVIIIIYFVLRKKRR